MSRDDLQSLTRLQKYKQVHGPTLAPLGEEMVAFYKQTVVKRQTKLAKIAECWGQLVPETLSDHCALHGLSRGTLTVLVDSSVHLYELKQLLLSGLENQLLMACKAGGVRKITLRPGRPDD
jgi:hypothetical protein